MPGHGPLEREGFRATRLNPLAYIRKYVGGPYKMKKEKGPETGSGPPRLRLRDKHIPKQSGHSM